MRTFKLAILGFGTAAKAFLQILADNHDILSADTGFDILVTDVLTRSRGSLHNDHGIDILSAIRQIETNGCFSQGYEDYIENTPEELLENFDFDCLIELTTLNIFTGLPAADYIRTALKRKKHVITANKGPLAWYYRELKELANESGVSFSFETTVLAGIPVFNLSNNCMQYCRITEIEGILNATTNFVLKEMGRGSVIDNIIEYGQSHGFMEADASMDLLGWDAAAKLTVLMNVLMDANITPLQIQRVGIDGLIFDDMLHAREKGCVLRLMCNGYIDNGKYIGTVMPKEISADSIYANEQIVAALTLSTNYLDKISILQYGLEPAQTGYGIFIDLVNLLKSN